MDGPATEIHIDAATMRELNLIEAAIGDVDHEVLAKQHLMSRPIFAARTNTIAKIPGFWARVFDNSASELEAAVMPQDQAVLAHALTNLELERFEIPATATATTMGLANFGEPRSVRLTFSFGDNEWFEDAALTKTFWFRYSNDESAGLVSEPVKIHWKPGKDLTGGLTDAAYAFWQAQKATPSQRLDDVLTLEERKARDAEAKTLSQYKSLASMLNDEDRDAEVTGSFFNFFSYRGRWVSAAEDKHARAQIAAKRAKAMAGEDDGQDNEEEEDNDDDDDEEDDFAEEDVETFPLGHDVAVAIADDIFPNAIEYFLAETIDDLDLDDDEDVEMS
jgi:hypothetical protein